MVVIATAALSFSQSVRDVAILRSIGGFAFAFFWPTSEALVIDLAPAENRVREMGIYSISWGLGFLIGPILGGLIVEVYGFMRLFAISAVLITLAFFMTVWRFVPRYSRRELHRAETDLSSTLSIMRRLMPWYMVTLCYGIISGVVMSIFPGYANSVGISPALIGVIFSTFTAARIFVFAVLRWLLNFGEVRLLLAVSAILGVGVLSLAVSPSFEAFLLIMTVIGCCFATIFPLIISMVSRHFPVQKLGAATGSYETVFGFGSAVGPILAGSVAHFMNVRWAFASLSLLSAAMFMFVTAGKTKTPLDADKR